MPTHHLPRWQLPTAILTFTLLAGSWIFPGPRAAGADPANAPKAAADAALPRVIRVLEPLSLGQPMTVELTGLPAWIAAGNSPSRLMPFLGGLAISGDKPEAIDPAAGTLRFHLAITPANRELWQDLLRRPTLSRLISVSVGPDPDLPFPTDITGSNKATLVIVPGGWGVTALGTVVAIIGLLLSLASRTDLLRDSGTAPALPARRPFSLARTQMAFWSTLILAGYVVIWLITGDLNTITESLLGLMGISAGTALGGALIDNNKAQPNPLPAPPAAGAAPAPAPPAAPVPPPVPEVSQGFLQDILSDERGISLHRFQMAIWTVVLGIIFIATAYNSLRMPEFSATLLGLRGISSGTYLGFKLPER